MRLLSISDIKRNFFSPCWFSLKILEKDDLIEPYSEMHFDQYTAA